MSQFGQWARGLFGARNSDPEVAAPPGAIPTPGTTQQGGPAAAVSPVDGPGIESAEPATAAVPVTSPLSAEPVPAEVATSSQAAAQAGGARSNLLPVLLGVAAIGLSLWTMREYASLLGPVFFTLNMMITAYPLYRFLTKNRVPNIIAIAATGLLVVGFLAMFLFGLYWSVAAMVQKLPEYKPQFTRMYDDIIEFLAGLGLSEQMIRDQIMSIDPQSIASAATGLLSDVGSVGSMIVVIVTALIFMLMDTPRMDERLSLARKDHGGFIGALGNFAQGIRKYWVVTTVFGLIVAVLDLAVLLGLGVPLALVWAIFSFLTNYIPNIGFVIGLVPPALLALFDSGPRTAIAVVIAYSVMNFVVQSIIQPKFAGNAVGLTPTLSFISLLLWTAVLGPLGALLALPMSLLVKALLIDPDPRTRWVNALISSQPQDGAMPAHAGAGPPHG